MDTRETFRGVSRFYACGIGNLSIELLPTLFLLINAKEMMES